MKRERKCVCVCVKGERASERVTTHRPSTAVIQQQFPGERARTYDSGVSTAATASAADNNQYPRRVSRKCELYLSSR